MTFAVETLTAWPDVVRQVLDLLLIVVVLLFVLAMIDRA